MASNVSARDDVGMREARYQIAAPPRYVPSRTAPANFPGFGWSLDSLPQGFARVRRLISPTRPNDLRRPAVLAVVLVLHSLVAVGLWRYRRETARDPVPPARTVVSLFSEVAAREPLTVTFDPTSRALQPQLIAPSTLTDPSSVAGETPFTPDWIESGRGLAAAIASQPAEQGTAKPPERGAKPFGWDVSRTRRWEPAPEGGTVVRLNDRCQIVFSPLPIGGCSLGKIEARGDLFDGMRQSLDSSDARSSVPGSP